MKKSLLVLAVFLSVKLFGPMAIGQALPNGGFENWNNGTFQDPQYYQSSDDNLNGIPTLTYTANQVRVSPGYHGTYAVQISTIKIGSDTLFGYVIDGSPNGNQVYGGIPYAQKPTGIRFYYKYSTVTTDSAMVITWFKKAGSVLATYVFKVSTLSGTFKLYSGTFTPALLSTPDTLVFGVTSSSFDMNKNGPSSGKPGSVFIIDSVTFTGVGSQPTHLNGDFENWSPVDTFFMPASWYPQPPVRWSNDVHAGSHSVQMNTAFDAMRGQVVAGMVSTGYWNCNGSNKCKVGGGYPYNQTNDSLTFWYKYAPAGSDTAWVNLNFIKDSVFDGTGLSLFGTSGIWRYATMPINLVKTPDTAVVSFGSSPSGSNGVLPSHAGSVLKIDNVQFKSQTSALQFFQEPANSITVSPNPGHGIFCVRLNNLMISANHQIEVYNLLGEKVLDLTNLHGAAINLDITSQPAGIFMMRVLNNNGNVVGEQRLIKF